MGCVTFIFDMIGYADSVQIPSEVAHKFGKQRPGFNTKENWGFYATQAESRLQSIMGLQTWNSIRRHRWKRRWHTDDTALRYRSQTGRGISQWNGLDGHAGRLHV